MRLLLGEVPPLMETEGLEGAIRVALHHLRPAFHEQGQGALDGAYVDSLPQPVQD